jgi:hypothetical protein
MLQPFCPPTAQTSNWDLMAAAESGQLRRICCRRLQEAAQPVIIKSRITAFGFNRETTEEGILDSEKGTKATPV